MSKSLHQFAGNGESSHKEGPVLESSFRKPCGLAVEFDNVVYVCDVDANRVNLITSLDRTSSFLREVGNLYAAFSVHEKGKKFQLQTSREAIQFVESGVDHLHDNERVIRARVDEQLPSALNGTHGYVASKTTQSAAMILSGLRRLESVLRGFGYTDLNLLTCLTIDVEHI